MKGMFKKFRKNFQGKEKDKKDSNATPATTTSNTTSTAPTQSAAIHTNTTATTVTSPPTSPLPSTSSATISPSSSPTLPTSHLKLGTSSSPTPPLLPSLSTPSSHSLPLDNSEGKPIGKKSISSFPPRSSAGLTLGGEKKEGGDGLNGVVGHGVNGQAAADDDDDDEAASASSPHQLTRADLLKPIPSLNEPSTPPQAASSSSSSSSNAVMSPSSSKQALFIHKLRLCCITFDWSKDDPSAAATALSPPLSLNPNASKDARAKESKRQQLLELLDYIGKSKSIYNEQTLHELMRMIAVNLFRALPPRSAELPSDEDEPVYEASWGHLQVVYELFLRFIVNNDIDVRTLKKHIHAQFVLHLLELFDSEDHRERDYLKTILHRIYAKFMSLRAFIRKAINHVFYTFMSQHSTAPHHTTQHSDTTPSPHALQLPVICVIRSFHLFRRLSLCCAATSRIGTAALRSCWRSWGRSSTALLCL